MKLSLFLSRRILQQRSGRFSSFIVKLAIAAIALSVAVMIIATALIQGFQDEIEAKMYGLWGHIYVNHAGVYNMLEAKPLELNQDFYAVIDELGPITYQAERSILGISLGYGDTRTKGGIRNIQPYVSKPGIIQADDNMEGIVVKGVNQDFDWKYLQAALRKGELPHVGDTTVSKEILLSEYTANRLQLTVGDKLKIVFVEKGIQLPRVFKISGLYSTGLEDYDKKFAVADMRRLQGVYGWEENQVAGFEVLTDNVDDIELFKDFLLHEVIPVDLFAGSVRDRYPAIFDWLDLQDTNKSVILLLMIIVSIVNMSTALLILILERTHMIGVLKTLGARNWTIQKVFLINAAHIISWGLIFGNLVGISLLKLQQHFRFIKLSEADYYLSHAPVAWSIQTILLINVGTLVVTLIALMLPSLAVGAVRPLKAIGLR